MRNNFYIKNFKKYFKSCAIIWHVILSRDSIRVPYNESKLKIETRHPDSCVILLLWFSKRLLKINIAKSLVYKFFKELLRKSFNFWFNFWFLFYWSRGMNSSFASQVGKAEKEATHFEDLYKNDFTKIQAIRHLIEHKSLASTENYS